METKKILQADILDIIFDQRNKTYGAYELRKNYERRARKAFSIAMLLTLLIISVPVIAAMLEEPPVPGTLGPGQEVIISDINTQIPPAEPVISEPVAPDPGTKVPTDIVEAAKVPEAVPENEPEEISPETGATGTPSSGGEPGGQAGGTGTDENGTAPVVVTPPEPEPDPVVPEYGVEELPEFPGGEDALLAYLNTHIKYPEKAVNHDAAGKVVLGFVVNKDGEIDDLQVIKSVGYGCDEEAIRVVGNMPKWKPGRNNGKAVRVYFNLPITFELK